MAYTIAEYGATCINVEPANENVALRWEPWRKQLIGKQGQLAICTPSRESETRFLRFEMTEWSEERQDLDEDSLETASGIVTIEGNILTFVSRNSRYTFELREQISQLVALARDPSRT